VGGDQLAIVPVDPAALPVVAAILERATGVNATVDAGARTVTAPTSDGVGAVAAIAAELRESGIAVEDLGLRQPTLDDVFLTLTGSATGDDAAERLPDSEGALR
jgi:ABC-2 type transport system ATP-binding protein